MRRSTKKSPPPVETWTKEDVHRWLMTEVKVDKTCADRFCEEEVSGDSLVDFKKTDILDLGIKHGPAVKVTSYLKGLTEGSQHESQFPEYVENWSKEQVSQWLLQHVNIYSKYAERLREEHVSGDCLVCFKKDDLLDLELKSGPAVKILAELRRLNEKPEPTLQPIPLTSTDVEEAPKQPPPEQCLAQAIATTQPESCNKTESKTEVIVENEKTQETFKKVSEKKKVQKSKPQNLGARRKEKVVTKGQPENPKISVMIQETLQHLLQRDLKSFHFHLADYDKSKPTPKPIPKSKLENKDTMDTATLMTDHFGSEALQVTKDILHEIDQRDLAHKLEKKMGQQQQQCLSKEVLKKEANQGDKLKNLLTCGGNSLDNYNRFVVVVNKSCPEQVQYLQFLSKMKLFSVLDFDPDSGKPGGLCHSYRESRVANLHSPTQYQGQTDSVIKNLNLYKQTSWVFCNGRHDLDGDANKELDYKNWLRKSCKDVEQLVSFICNPEVLLRGRSLIIFLLLSPVENEKDPIFDTYRSFIKHTEEENIITICASQSTYSKWRELIQEKCEYDIDHLSINDLTLSEINGTIMALGPFSQSSGRLLPSSGSSAVVLKQMWDLREEFRCAVLKDNTLPKTEVASQVRRLMTLESDKPTPVLLFVDDSKETENPHDLVNCIQRAATEDGLNINEDDAQNCKVIILCCVRCHSPMEEYRKHNQMQSQYITASLRQEEQKEFEKKLKELEETHDKPENFYSFMIMKTNFDQKYIEDLARNTLENFNSSSETEQKLFAFLALLNTYVAASDISLSLCEDFLEIKGIRWKEENLMDRMKLYSNVLIIDTVEEWGHYKGIRILHHSIASACLERLEKSCPFKVSDTTMEILHCDLFFSDRVVKQSVMLSIKKMLIERQRREDGDDREAFSSLINKIHNQKGRETVQEIFVKASSRFVTSAPIPQALARYLYIKERDFPEAVKWAEKAKSIKENPYTSDTIGQIHKKNLKTNINREKKDKSHNPEDLHTNIKIAQNAITAFKRAQKLANTEDEQKKDAADDESDDYPRKSYNVYGYVGVLEIAFLVFEILARLPFFEENDPMKKRYLQSFLIKTVPITSVYKEDNEINNRYVEIIKDHEQFLVRLKTEVKETFEILDEYFTYIKANNSEYDSKNHRTSCDLFKKYVDLFCTEPEEMTRERQNTPNLNQKIDIGEKRSFLEKNQADTFAGILQHLDKPAEQTEKITECYEFLQKQQQFIDKKQKTRETINYILSNIVLYLLKPKSKAVKSHSQLCTLLSKTLQEVGPGCRFPDPYFLALLLFWPSPTEENTEIVTYVTEIRKSSCNYMSKRFPRRSTIAYFYLGKGKGLQRLVSKRKLDEHFRPEMPRGDLAQLWRNGHIFKEKEITRRLHRVSGITEQGQMFAIHQKMKIPVLPARIHDIRHGCSTEKVSFYLGFAINGLLAYDIQYEN